MVRMFGGGKGREGWVGRMALEAEPWSDKRELRLEREEGVGNGVN